MDDTRTQTGRKSECGHHYRIAVGPLSKCTYCGDVAEQPITRYDPNCPDCEFDTHRCGHCGQTLDHTEAHRCPKVYG